VSGRARFTITHLIGDRSTAQVARDLAVTRRTVERWVADGVNWEQADEFAARVLGCHPATVFGPEWCAAAGYDHLARIGDLADDCSVIPRQRHAAPGQSSLFAVA